MSLEPLRPDPGLLMAYLQRGGHTLDPVAAAGICESLPDETKSAAKLLREALASAGVTLKHTHALQAVAEARGARTHFSVTPDRWEVASWVPEAPAVSARRRRVSRMRDAADIVVERLREQLDGEEAPLMRLLPGAQLGIEILSDPTPGWRAVIAHLGPQGKLLEIPEGDRTRFAERVRRLVEGEHGGWLSGALVGERNDGARFRVTSADGARQEFEEEFQLVRQVSTLSQVGGGDDSSRIAAVVKGLRVQVASDVGDSAEWLDLNRAELDRLVARLVGFERRGETAFWEWLDAALPSPDHGFEPQPLNRVFLDIEMQRQKIHDQDVEVALGIAKDSWARFRGASQLPVQHFSTLAKRLGLRSANPLLGRPAKPLPRIPMREVEALGLFLGKMDHVTVDASVGVRLPRPVAASLSKLCEVAYAKRRRWVASPPREIGQLIAAAASAESVLCAHLESRFVADLPGGDERLAVALIVSAHPSRVVDQYAPAATDDSEPLDHPIDEVWLKRFNRQTFQGEEILRYSNMVAQMRDPEDDGKGHFETQAFAGVKVFAKNADKAHAATVRMEAFAHLMTRINLEPWIHPSTDNGAHMISRPVFDAIARCPLIEVNGRAGFAPDEFQKLIVASVVVD